MDISVEVKVDKVVGMAKDGGWAQVFWYEPEDEEVSAKRGKLFAIFEIFCADEFLSADSGKNAFEALKEAYFQKSSGGVLEALEEAVDVSSSNLKNQLLSSKIQEVREKWHFGISAASLWGKVLYLANYGAGQVLLIRNKKSQPLIIGQKTQIFETAKIKTVSGYIENDDLLIITTGGLGSIISLDEIYQIKSQGNVNELIENLTAKVGAVENSSQVAALVIGIKLVAKPTAEEQITFVESKHELKKDRLLLPLKKFFASFAVFVKGSSQYLQSFPFKLNFKPRLAQKKLLPILLIVLSLVFLASVLFGIRARFESGQKKQFSQYAQQISEEIAQGEGLLNLNSIEARKHFLKASKLLEEAKRLKVEKKKTDEFEQKIAQGLESSKQVYKLDNLDTFYDLSLVKDQARGSKISLFDNNLVIWDEIGKSLLLVNKTTKAAEILAGGDQVSAGKMAAVGNNSAFLYASDGVYAVDLKEKQIKKVAEPAEVWGQIVDIDTFANNFYLLDGQNKQIFKYVPVGDGYEGPNNYIKEEQKVDFGDSALMTIDGLIWLISQNGQITKLVGGVKEQFNPVGIPDSFTNVTSIDGDDRANNLYILDAEAKRIVVISKDGQYQSQYQADALAHVTDIVVDEPNKKLYALSASKILLINLQ